MKALLSLFAFLFLFVSCSSFKIIRQYEYRQPGISINSNVGFLKIYTDTYFESGQYGEDVPYEVYKGYSIYTKNGNFVKDVGQSYYSPQQVKLVEGSYVIVAELNKNGTQSFTVSIEKGKITVVDKSLLESSL